MAHVTRLLQTLLARGRLARQTVHRQQHLGVIAAHRVPNQRRSARLHQRMLGQRSARRMAQLAAAIAVANLALFAHDGRHARLRFAHLAAQRFALAEPIHDRFHRSISGQIACARFVEEHQLPAHRTGQRVDGRSADGRRWEQQTVQIRRAGVRARPRGATDDARVGLAEDADLVGLVLVAGAALVRAAGAAVARLRRRRRARRMVMMLVVVLVVVMLVLVLVMELLLMMMVLLLMLLLQQLMRLRVDLCRHNGGVGSGADVCVGIDGRCGGGRGGGGSGWRL